MKVVLFCGGYGSPGRAAPADLPKPMHLVGPRPLLWHLMRFYAHYGHTEFVLCLGYGAHHVKDFFLHYDETGSNNFVLRGQDVQLLGHDVADWRITFVHTGLEATLSQRLHRVRAMVEHEEMFLANYASVLSDLRLDDMLTAFRVSDALAAMAVVPPQAAFHTVEIDGDGALTSIMTLQQLPLWQNGGFFALRPQVFDQTSAELDLLDGFAALAARGRMIAYRHRGFWQPAETVKDVAVLEAAYRSGVHPWMPWQVPDRDPLQSMIDHTVRPTR